MDKTVYLTSHRRPALTSYTVEKEQHKVIRVLHRGIVNQLLSSHSLPIIPLSLIGIVIHNWILTLIISL